MPEYEITVVEKWQHFVTYMVEAPTVEEAVLIVKDGCSGLDPVFDECCSNSNDEFVCISTVDGVEYHGPHGVYTDATRGD